MNTKIRNPDFKYLTLLLICIAAMATTGCPTTNPILVDEDRVDIDYAIPEDTAKQIIERYTDRNWAENPFLDTTVKIEVRKANGFIDSKLEKDKTFFKYSEFVLRPHAYRRTCIFVSTRDMRSYEYEEYIQVDKNTAKFIDYKPKEICARTTKEREKLINAFISLGADWSRW